MDNSSDDTVRAAASRFTILVGGHLSRGSILEDNAVGTAAAGFTVLVGGNRGRKNNVVEGIHVESVSCACVVAVMRTEHFQPLAGFLCHDA